MRKVMMIPVVAISIAAICLFTLPATNANSDNKPSAKNITFTKDVAPIFFKQCVECHRAGEIAPFSALSYKDVRPWAKSIREKVVSREMPPWHADPKHGDWLNDRRLTEREIDTIIAWVDGGALEGNPKDLPPAPQFTEGWNNGKPDMVISMPDEFSLPASGPDDYIYFRVPTNFTEDKWVQAVEVRPGNRRVVHHAIVLIETISMYEAAKANARRKGIDERKAPTLFEDTAGITRIEGTVKRAIEGLQVIDDGCSAPGGGGIGGITTQLGDFAPGRNADVWAPGMAKRIPAGSNLVFQMHYAKTTGKPEKDRTSVGLIFARSPVEKMIESREVTNFFFKIPAGAENHEVTACHTFERDVELINFMPHMHMRGKDMKYEIVYPEGRRETLLSVNYDFNWQTLYRLKKPLPIPKGSRLIVTGHFDNSSKNKHNPDPTQFVRFGDPTYDEMFVGFVDYIYHMPKDRIVARIDPKIYDSYAGKYSTGTGFDFAIHRESDKLYFVGPKQPMVEAFPESETRFFFKVADAQMTFIKNEKGEVNELIFEIDRQTIKARRIGKTEASASNQ
ncbi:MAG TPA: DUF3471 domain-containing protein [Blastocatellia bacterium]|nr:DUF3471 domain-containing protein [Blastocatellia bacterium]